MSEDIKIPAATMGQAMTIAASMVVGLVEQFIKPNDTDEEKTTMTYVCLSIFLYQLCAPAKYKEKMIGVLEAIIAQLRESVE